MSELINNSKERISNLKKLILKLHDGDSVEKTRAELINIMGKVPYGEVVAAEEELIREGLEREEVLKFCDIHTEALKGNIDPGEHYNVPEGHPIETFKKENNQLTIQINKLKNIYNELSQTDPDKKVTSQKDEIESLFISLMDIEKHYQRKENLVFPFLEKYEITGPPMVMWGKHDEVRAFLKSSMEALKNIPEALCKDIIGYFELLGNTTIKSIEEMIYKEENILFPMCLDTLNEIDWFEVYQQSNEIGYCLYSPEKEWKPNIAETAEKSLSESKINLSTGSFSKEELEGIFSSIPYDLTFVDKDDKVRFFSHGKDRIFQRNKAILGREVQYCHPPSSVHIVNQIVDDFKLGKQDNATFWINFQGKVVHIAYYAVRNDEGKYLGVVETTQDITKLKSIDGERRLLTYDKK